MKSWISCWKCLQAIVGSTFFTSFQSYIKVFFVSPTYCLLHKMHPINFILLLLAHLTLWNFVFFLFFFGWLTLKSNCFSYLFATEWRSFVSYGKHFSGFSFCIFLFLTLFFSILLLPINSLRFSFGFNAVIGWQLNIFLEIHLLLVNSSVFVSLWTKVILS